MKLLKITIALMLLLGLGACTGKKRRFFVLA